MVSRFLSEGVVYYYFSGFFFCEETEDLVFLGFL